MSRRDLLPKALLAGLAAVLSLVWAAPAQAADFSLTITVGGEGEIKCKIGSGAPEPCESEYAGGTNLTLVPGAEEGWRFAGFSAGSGSAAACTGVKTSCTFAVAADSAVTAGFEPVPEYSLDVNLGGNGAGWVECKVGGVPEWCEPKYPEKTKVTLVPVAEEGSKFAGFSAGSGSAMACNGLLTSCTITIEANSSITATFSLKEFSLKVIKGGDGAGSWECERETGPEPCATKYPYGSYVYLTAVASPGSEFSGWSGECSAVVGAVCEVEMEKSREVVAGFAAAGHTLGVERLGSGSGTVTSSPAGIDCGTICSVDFPAGAPVTLTAVPAPGSKFVGWNGSSCSGTGSCEVTMSQARWVSAYFSATPTVVVDPAPTPAPPPQQPPRAAGIASAAAVALVRGRLAKLRLGCSGGPCKGVLELRASLRLGGRRQSLAVGTVPFELSDGASEQLQFRISRRVALLLQSRGFLVLTAKGLGVSSRKVRLVSPTTRKSN